MDENETLMNEGEAGAATQQGEEQQAKNPEAAEREAQSRFNAQMAAARKSGAAEARKDVNSRIAAMGRVNPSTGRTMESMEDVLAYFDAQQRSEDEAEAKKTGQSVDAVSADRKARQLGRAQMAAEARAAEERAKMDSDVSEFMEAYPGVDLAKLLSGPFKEYLDELGGNVSLTRAYKTYSRLTEKKEQAERSTSRDERSTGGGGTVSSGKLTASQRQALEEWNRTNPAMKMTEEEFAGR